MHRFNFCAEPLIRVLYRDGAAGSLSLPSVLAETMAGEDRIATFPSLRAHQRHAWHAMVAQLGALATMALGATEPPMTEAGWRDGLQALTPDDPEAPWSLVTPPDRPALLQPPLPGGDASALKNRITTPDDLDMLLTARNHDLKRATMADAEPEDWLFALISLQTMEGFLGAGNYGISRMNGGFANRPALGIAPPGGPGAHLRRDILRLLELRPTLPERGYSQSGGIALVWLRPWDGASSLGRHELDPYYIEICRRVRLIASDGRVSALAGGSAGPRIAEAPGGVTGDPWAPLVAEKQGAIKVFTPDSRGFGYSRMVDLMVPASNLEAPLQLPSANDTASDLVLVARALVRGQGKTEGYHERRVPAPRKIARMFGSKSEAQRVAEAARLRVKEAGIMSWNVLRPALIALFENGPERDALDLRNKDAERKARGFLDAFEQFVDRDFFPDLWAELEEEDSERRAAAHRAWVRKLLAHAEALLHAADERVGRSTQRRYRARVRAKDILHGRARANPDLNDYFQTDNHAS